MPDGEMNWDYIAGFFDGEGSVYYREDQKYLKVVASVVNTNERVIRDIYAFIEGKNIKSFIQVKQSQNPKWNTAYVLTITDHIDVLSFLQNILERCIVKKEKVGQTISKIRGRNWIKRDKLRGLTKEKLYELYWREGMSLREIGMRYGATASSVHIKIKKLGIPGKPWKEARKLYIDRVHTRNPPCPRCGLNKTVKSGSFSKNPEKWCYRCRGCDRSFVEYIRG